MKTIKLTSNQLLDCIQEGDFSADIRTKSRITVILMSQVWCPQYTAVKNTIDNLEEVEGVSIFETLYDQDSAGDAFMTFKEQGFKNHLIPYLRFYKNGSLFKETNYLSAGAFRQFISS